MSRALAYTTLPLTVLTVILCFVPLLNILGYEFSFFLGIGAALTSFILGAVIASPDTPPLTALLKAYRIALLALLPPLLLISLNAFRVRNCDFAEGLTFFLLLPCISALYGTTLGACSRRIAHFALPTALRPLLYPVVLLSPLAFHLYWLYAHPPIFVFDHLFGFYMGSLYDEALKPDQRLVLFRMVTLGRVLILIGLTSAWHIFRPRSIRMAITLTAIGTCLLVDFTVGPAVGYRVSRSDIIEVLSREERVPGLIIHMPADTSDAQARALVLDHQFRLAQLKERFGLETLPDIHSFVYKNTKQKGRLMGGSNTMIAKPWLGEIHIHGLQTPHRVLAHELAHAVASEFGSDWLRISARYELLPNMGFIEGLAMAFTPPMYDSSLHVYAATMRRQGRAPDLRAILGAEGFYRYAAGRAYNVAGSFIRYLLDNYGAEPLKQAYPQARFEEAFGKPLDDLVEEWESFLDALDVPLPEKRAATERFRRPSIFERPCAHVVAELKRQAREAKPKDAVAIYEKLCGFEGNTPASRLALAKALRRAGDTDAFKTLAQSLIDEGTLNPTQLSQLQELLGSTAWSSGQFELAREAFEAAFALRNRLNRQRLQWFKLNVFSYDEPKRSTLMNYLDQKLPRPIQELSKLYEEDPDDASVGYLLARLHYNKAQYERAVSLFQKMPTHPFAPIEAERWRLLADSHWRLGKLAQSKAYFQKFADEFAPNSGESERGLDWVERVQWAITNDITPYLNTASGVTE